MVSDDLIEVPPPAAGYTDEYGITFGTDGLIVGNITFLPGASSSTDGPGETMRSQFLKEIGCLEQALDFYKDRISSYNEEEMEEERQGYFTRTITSMLNDTVLDDGAPRFMPQRGAKKARGGAGYESKNELLLSLNQTTRMHLGMAASNDPDVQAACLYATQRTTAAQLNPLQQFGELLSNCSDEQFEKIISLSSGTNNAMKFDYITKAFSKQVFDLVQLREMQNREPQECHELLVTVDGHRCVRERPRHDQLVWRGQLLADLR